MNEIEAKKEEIAGQNFERLMAVTLENKHQCWCECICGEWIIVRINSLKSGSTKSCGCLQREMTRKTNITHGMSNNVLYATWKNMLNRCYDLTRSDYKNYGGRGIKVCKRWHSLKNFVQDMKDKSSGLTLERKDNDGNYEPSNCRWATDKEQRTNKRPISHGPSKQFRFRAWHKNMMCQFMSNNQHEFAKQHNLHQAGISQCLCKQTKQHKGWMFKRI